MWKLKGKTSERWYVTPLCLINTLLTHGLLPEKFLHPWKQFQARIMELAAAISCPYGSSLSQWLNPRDGEPLQYGRHRLLESWIRSNTLWVQFCIAGRFSPFSTCSQVLNYSNTGKNQRRAFGGVRRRKYRYNRVQLPECIFTSMPIMKKGANDKWN